MEPQQPTNPCGLSDAQVAELKKKHGPLKVISLKDSHGAIAQAVVRKPSGLELDSFLVKTRQQPYSAFVHLFNTVVVAKDANFITDEMLNRAGIEVNNWQEEFEAEVKNL